MANPNTWQLLEAMQLCLQEVTVVNGYHTDAGNYVTLEPGQIPDTETALIGLVLDAVTRPEDPAARSLANLATIVVIGKVKATQTNAQLMLHKLIEDIQKAVAEKYSKFKVGTTQPRFVEARIISPAEGMNWVGAEVRYSTHVRLR